MRKLFFAEIAAIVFAAVIFRFDFDPRIAGMIAGVIFIAVGLYGIQVSWRDRRNRHITLAVGALALIHVIGVALPMLGYRILNWNEPFSKVAVWGLSGPLFHTLSTRFFGLWMTVTAFAWWLERKKDPRGPSFRKIKNETDQGL